ncbi:MAG: hypothetical protein AB8G22_11630 [Saprospiraceae bacterium]
MKYLFYLPCFLLFFSCQNDTAPKSEEVPTEEAKIEATKPGEYVNAPGLNDPYKAIAEGIWVIEGYIAVGDKNAQEQNVNRWYKLDVDGTYERGRYGEKRGSGNWVYEEEEKLLTFEDEEGAFNSQFKIRLATNGQSMIIIGTNRYNQRRIQGKWVKATDFPKE